MPINLSYPKSHGNILSKFFRVLRTDNGTVKAVLPKDAIVVGIMVTQDTAAATAAATFDIGWSGNTDALVDGFSMATGTAVGHVAVGATRGLQFGNKLTADRKILSTYIAGSSTAGGEGMVEIRYLVPGPQETQYS